MFDRSNGRVTGLTNMGVWIVIVAVVAFVVLPIFAAALLAGPSPETLCERMFPDNPVIVAIKADTGNILCGLVDLDNTLIFYADHEAFIWLDSEGVVLR